MNKHVLCKLTLVTVGDKTDNGLKSALFEVSLVILKTI